MNGAIFNMGFWELFIRNQFIKQIDLLFDSIQNRLIPTFNNLEKEAEQVAERRWEELCSSCYFPDIDPEDLAEQAQEAGTEHYNAFKYKTNYFKSYSYGSLSFI